MQSHRASVVLENKFVGGETRFEYSVSVYYMSHSLATGLVAGLD